MGNRIRAGENGVNNQRPGDINANAAKGDMTHPLLVVEDLKMYFPVYGGVMRRKVAQVSKKWFRIRDTYGVEISPDQEDILILAVTVALDQMAHD
jgi:hypothetical protein